MSFSLPPADTLSILLNEPCLSNQTISFGQESIKVNRFVLAAHSTYFRSLWFLEFSDKSENTVHFSHLPVSSNDFFSFITSFYGQPFILNENNAYDFYFLVHYFQVEKLIEQVETYLNTRLVTWAWLKLFIKAANERNDLNALKFAGPLFPMVSDGLIDDVMAITTEGFQILSKYCTSSQSLIWLIKSIVSSILNQSFNLREFLNILNSCSIKTLSCEQWDEFLFVPLRDVDELDADLNHFLNTKVYKICIECWSKVNSLIDTQTPQFEKSQFNLNEKLTADTIESHNGHQSKMIRFSQTRKNSHLQVSDDMKTVVVSEDGRGNRNILGEDPLLPGNVYTWKLRYQGSTDSLLVGVIDDTQFVADGYCFEYAHYMTNHVSDYGRLSGTKAQWNPGEVLEISVDLINYTLSIKSMDNSSIKLTGTLPRLSSGNYYPWVYLRHGDHVLTIIE
ncbi:hypothetical protein GEMRC1_004221 [Eukaryota sp. GEM-RC1]